MSIEIIILGGTEPTSEERSRANDPGQSTVNGKKIIMMLRKKFGEEPSRAKLELKSEMTNIGQVFAVTCSYDSDDAEANAYCHRIEGHMPSRWENGGVDIKNPQK